MAISELKVANASNVVNLLGKSVPQEQWRRELLENARHAGAKTVIFDAWHDPESRRDLIRVSDDGCGMNPRMLERRIRDLADPTRAETFGIGGRVSTAMVSPSGVAWSSREQDAPAAMVLMRRERGRWGLAQFPDEDGRVAHAVEPIEGMLSRIAREHGTSVVLYGDGRHNSWRPGDANRLATYLARRYWTFGETTVKVNGWRTGGQSSNPTVRVPPTGELVERHLEASDIVILADGSQVRWYRVGDSQAEGGYRSVLATGLAVQHGDELYDRADRMRLARFGVYTRSAAARIVLVVEPSPELRIEPNAERTRLVRPGGRDLPWQEWARSFVEQLPPEIAELLPTSMPLDLEQLAARFGNEWRDRIKPLARPLRARNGTDQGLESALELAAHLDPAPPTEKPEPDDHHEDGEQEEPPGAVEAEPKDPTPPRRKAVNVEADGRTRSRSGRRHDVPEPRAIEPEQWEYGDHMDFAYLESMNELHYKTTGEAIVRQTRYWAERHNDDDPQLVAETVRSAYAVEMVGKILHVLDVYAGREGWTDPLDELLSPRALTFASLGFHAVDAMIEERLRAVMVEEELADSL
jgi:hypothetical protein